MDNGTMQVLPVEAGGTFALPMQAVSSIQHLHLETSITGSGPLSSNMEPRIFDLHQLMWGQPSFEGRRFIVMIRESDLTFGLLVNRVLTARPLEELHPLPDTFLKAKQLFQGLLPLDDGLVPILDIENLSIILQRTPWMTHDDHIRSHHSN